MIIYREVTMYFNGTNDTNIDDEFGKKKKLKIKKAPKEPKEPGEKKKIHFNQDTLLMCFYGLLLIVGIILIIISVK